MKKNLTLNSPGSAGLRDLLKDHLIHMFTSDIISKYLVIETGGTGLQILDLCPDHALRLPRIKMAFSIWGSMEATDRHAVLTKFHCLCSGLPFFSPGNRKTLIFCALFIHEFSVILAEAMQWPD